MNKQYPKYKKSNIDWITRIPEDWKAIKMHNCFDERVQKGFPNEPPLCATQKYGVIPQSLYENRVVVVNKGFDKLKLVKVGDFVISLRSFQGGIEYAYYQGIISQAYTILRIKNNEYSQFFRYLLKSFDFIQLLKVCVKGIREGQNINYSVLSQKFLPIPPLPTQSAIVSFLETKTSLIDNYIDKKQKEIELLKEYKKALIAKVVTKGIDKNAKMKPSGISWIGDIPEDWEVKKFKNFFDERVQKGFPNEQPLCSTQKYGVIPQSLYENRVVVVNKDFDKLKLVKIGDFVISLRSFQGGIEYAYYQGIISQAYTILKIRDIAFTNYTKYLFKSFNFIQLLQTCVTGIREGQNINYSLLREKYIPLPPVPVQSAIVSYLDEKTSKIDVNISNIEKQILSLKDYKQKLIADVVTGRIMVE